MFVSQVPAEMQVFIHTTHRVRCRSITANGNVHVLLRQLSSALRDMEMESDEIVNKLTSTSKAGKRSPVATDPYFSNICGKLCHRPHAQLIREGVKPLIVHVKNGFGNFMSLYSRHANLVIYNNLCCTLFRGGRNTAEIRTVIEHTLCMEYVTDATMHMFVVSATLGCNIAMTCSFLQKMFENDNRWVCSGDSLSEADSCKHIKLKNIDPAWVAGLCPAEICTVKQMLITISIGGNINIFITPQKPVDFVVGVEQHLLPLCKFVYEFIKRAV